MLTNNTEYNGVKFGCGFVFGLIVGFMALAFSVYSFGFTEIIYVLGIAIVFGFASMKFGNAFWRAVRIWMP